MKEPVVNFAELVLVGAGPIGLELAVILHRMNIPFIHLEARQIGHTFTWWPRNTPFFSTTERIEIAGIPIQKVNQERTTDEEYLAYLRNIVEQFDLKINTYEPVVDIHKISEGFNLQTHTQTGERYYQTRKLILAIGDMDFPNLSNIPGEDLEHVSHYFLDPHPYFRKRLLIVGGKNSAVETALRCWRSGSYVTISYRRAAFDETAIKHWLLPDINTQIRQGNIGFLPETRPIEILPGSVTLERIPDGSKFSVQTDFVLLNTGFTADTTLYEKAGVNLSGTEKSPEYDPETMETNVPGLYVAGTTAAGSQSSYRLFIENTHVHVGKIIKSLTGQWPKLLGTIPSRQYDVPLEEIQKN